MTSDVSGYRPTPGRDAMTRDGRHRASGLTRNEVGGFDGHLQDLAGVYVAHPTWDESGRVLVLNVEYPEGWSLVRDADPLPDADVWVPKVGDRVKLVKDGLSTTGAVGMEGVIKKIEDRTYPYLIELDKGLVYKSHAVSHQYRLTRADRGCFVSAVRPAPSGPVVEETVKRIVPGRYGVVEVRASAVKNGVWLFDLRKANPSKAEVLAAAETLRQIGEAMEGK